MLLTTKYVDDLPLHRFEKVLARHGVDLPRQTLARWMIQCGEHLQPLLNLLREQLLMGTVIHCDETRASAQGGRTRSEQPVMNAGANWRSAGSPGGVVRLHDQPCAGGALAPARWLPWLPDDYAGYNAVAALPGIERLACLTHARRKFVEAQKVQPKGKTGRADVALNLINRLYAIERELKDVCRPYKRMPRPPAQRSTTGMAVSGSSVQKA